jgi:predicted ABC-type ATPase
MKLQDLFEASKKPQFVLVMGGGGSGKNHFIEHDPVLKKYKLIDVDEIKKTVPLDAAIKATKEQLLSAFDSRIDVVHPTTGSNLKGQINKMTAARDAGYEITLILKDTPIEQAMKQVAARVKAGGHGVLEKDIIASNQKARENFNNLKAYADHSKVV